MTSIDTLASSAILLDAEGHSLLDDASNPMTTGARVEEAVRRLQATGFTVLYTGRRAVSVDAPATLYQAILGEARPAGLFLLPENRLEGTPYECLIGYIAGFEIVPPPLLFP